MRSLHTVTTGLSRRKRALLLKVEQCPLCFFRVKTRLCLLFRCVLQLMLVDDRINYSRNELIGNHPEVMAENAKIVITVQSTPTDEQTLAKIQQMIDASVERLKDSMKFQIQQEKQVEQVAPTVLNQKDLDDMLDNLTIFDQ